MLFKRLPVMAPKKSRIMPQRKNCNKNGDNNTGKQKPKMQTENKAASFSNTESEEDEQSTPGTSSQTAGTSIKVTLIKTRSSSSTSSRESTKSFKVVKNVLPETKTVSGEDGDDHKDSNSENPSNIKSSDKFDGSGSENETSDNNESGEEYHPSSSSISDEENNDDEILSLSSTDSGKTKPAVPVKVEKEFEKIKVSTDIDLKAEEIPQINPVVKKEESKVKLLKKECSKEADSDVVVVNDDNDDDNSKNNAQTSKPSNETGKMEVKEHKFKVNVRSFDDLADPSHVNLINMPPPGQLDRPPNYLTQNGAPFPPPPFMSCEVCGLQFESSELLNEHKSNMKHFKCSFKDCELLVISSHQEFLDHQRLTHNIMPSPVQQLAHQVQRLPAMGFDQQLQSGVPPLPENLPPPTGMPNLYTQTLRLPSQPVPMQRSMRPIIRPTMAHMMPSRSRGVTRGQRGRPASIIPNMGRGGSPMKRTQSMPLRGTPPLKRAPTTDRNSYTNNSNKQIVKSLSESLTKSISHVNKVTTQQQEVVNLFSKRGLTISTVDKVNNISIPATISLNSAVSIIPTSPRKNVDTVDLTGPDKPSEKKFYPCEVCSKTYLNIEKLYEHISYAHKSVVLTFKCSLCGVSFPTADILNRHKTTKHKSEVNSSIPFVIPILDISKASTVSKLQSMGVTNYVPVAQLDQTGGQYGLPIMSISRPGSVDGLKFTNFFNLGCVRKL